MVFVRNYTLICRFLYGLFGFEGLIEYGADEVVEAEVTLLIFFRWLVFLWEKISFSCFFMIFLFK